LAINPFGGILGIQTAIDAIAADAASETLLRSTGGVSIWERIISVFAARYLFDVVCLASTAIVVPVIPGLRATWRTVTPDEYTGIQWTDTVGRPIRGVVLNTGANSMTGAFGFQRGQGNAITTMGGIYENTDVPAGLMLFRDAPQWVSNAVSREVWAPGAAGPNGEKATAINPDQGVMPGIAQPAAIRAQAQTLWDAYARATYLFEALKMRRMSFTGKLRFDIAPGSSLEIVCVEEPFVARANGTAIESSHYGTVTRVTTIIDSESMEASSSFELAYVRNEAENNLDSYSTTVHPLWTAAWVGGPLVEQPEFGVVT
jgi:hypothetical protein